MERPPETRRGSTPVCGDVAPFFSQETGVHGAKVAGVGVGESGSGDWINRKMFPSCASYTLV